MVAQITKDTSERLVNPDDLKLLETLAALESAPEIEPNDKIVHKSNAEVPVPIIRTATKSAGYVYLRRNSNGALVMINKNQLLQVLKLRLPDGRPSFLPPSTPWQGHKIIAIGKCLLHPSDPNRGKWDELGLPVCMKSNMPKQSIRPHMMLKHKMAWNAIQEVQREQREDRRDKNQEIMAKGIEKVLKGRKKRA